MKDERFYISQDDIVFESYEREPDLEVIHFRCEPEDSPIRFCMRGEEPVAVDDHCLCATDAEACVLGDRLVTVNIDRLRKAGVPEYLIDIILENEEELSSMRITRTGRILLPDYKIEVKMAPLDKALYFLFLRHPEGIRFKDLSDHRGELMDLYASVTGRDDNDAVSASIDSLINPLSNSVNEKCSRIKRAFTKAFSPELARNYYIDGKSGEPKSIALDRSLVTWETLIS